MCPFIDLTGHSWDSYLDDLGPAHRYNFRRRLRNLERLGRLRLRLMDRSGAVTALERARLMGPSVEGLLDLALAYHLAADVGAEVSAAEAATRLDPESHPAWSRYAHALARTDRLSECLDACRRSLALGDDVEVSELLARVEAAQPRHLSDRTAA